MSGLFVIAKFFLVLMYVLIAAYVDVYCVCVCAHDVNN